MNKVTYVLLKMIKREGWSAFMLFRRMKRMFLWLLMMCTLMGPEYATADGCKSLDGNVRLLLPSSVSFPPGGHSEASESNPELLFTGSTYSIRYECTNTKVQSRQVRMARLNDFTPLLQALQKAGMKLTFIIADSSGGTVTWTPTLQIADTIPFGAYYTGTVERVVNITPKLYLIKPPTAGFSVVPTLTAFEIISGLTSGASRFDGPQITTSAVRIQYVPTCFVQTSLPQNNVDFGPVITYDVNQSLSLTRPFKVSAVASNEDSCVGDSNLRSYYSVGYTKFYLNLPLKVTFFVNSGGVISGGNSIRLYKDGTSDENGLQLKIYDGDGHAVLFNNDNATLPVISPANKLGEFDGTPGSGGWMVTKQYMATLSSTGGRVLTGKYNVKVIVKVSYY
ncbi:hypothetical protein DQD43_07540 [Salmonella enterica subsp. enterica serovar Newport]|uniref:Fimbrial protein n=1 Tax=Salmonella newport TaxID=108619 RepID=A0A5V9CHH1_SALNE|nr:hypothetical protein [Salmonella enterica subsp. enterica serovar Newport]EBQ9422322.1 hypothetical protein [Salmonella enterica subsp. enterica serovar Newport]EBS1164823.1 hypothetical protein [Salmonella enterica subsp. enterica serovar Newport]EBS6022080.1 hypothetical protein [Salmonella enterica subsp. enterica serovar Newport]EBU8125269.1 hypothetical protein [Salmonella enterica subsp. enterica serovar Newport]